MGENPWVVEVDKEVDNLRTITQAQKKEWKQHCIYKLPAWVTDLNKNAYKPRVISFGPYHYDDPNLKPMEAHKHRALLHFLKTSWISLRACVDRINAVVKDLKAAYDSLDTKWEDNSEEFVKLMIRDGCFMLEILRHGYDHQQSSYAENDPIFSNHGQYMMPHIKRDMLMLQNQLPMLLLTRLLSFRQEVKGDVDDYINKLVIKFCSPPTSNKGQNLGKCKHVLDVYRKSLLWEDSDIPPQWRTYLRCFPRLWWSANPQRVPQ